MSEQEWDTDRVWTVPNVLSFLRLLAIPVFVWLILAHLDLAAVIVLAVSAVTDWCDGFLARALRQRTRLGAQLDPVSDRLYILATIIALLIRGIVPWPFVVVLVARDVLLLCLWPFLRRTGRNALPVNMVGKSGTFLLLLAFPVVLLGAPEGFDMPVVHWVGWACAVAGAVLYWAAGVLYVKATRRVVAEHREEVEQ
ncbi:CDP-alcohol phosphatidyltransferase family protein [uncultured Tessaracoccus sp.]|uniref:CDP-alcohol phosphatidyltransferase family protein n=1 Tax=uncultured Tessaracoccus sp. TaxID=905023 RepID=UPI0025EC09EC|nr:CDP-alcohol phosphatidyltransferase family protein [uncultured Tessaracoccus sp.]